jgi:sulfite exporter TauE/SafE
VNGLIALNLWSPHQGLSVGAVIVTAFVLGLVHGVTPDEHTWPITFSYAVGSFSARKGMRSALAFSLSFTLQRSLLSELAYLGFVHVVENPTYNAVIYVVVGVVMAAAAFYVLRLHCVLHLHLWPPSIGECHRPSHAETDEWAGRVPTPRMAAVHGFVAGWGLGAFALIMATVLAPAMPSAALGWVPGAAFGLGTTAVLAGAGAVIGTLIRHQRLPERLAQRVAQDGAGWTLLVGGVLFAAAGVVGLVDPHVMTSGISTGIHVHNLDQLGIGTVLVVLVIVVTAVVITRTMRRFRDLPPAEPGGGTGRTAVEGQPGEACHGPAARGCAVRSPSGASGLATGGPVGAPANRDKGPASGDLWSVEFTVTCGFDGSGVSERSEEAAMRVARTDRCTARRERRGGAR